MIFILVWLHLNLQNKNKQDLVEHSKDLFDKNLSQLKEQQKTLAFLVPDF